MDDIEMPGRVHDRVMREAHRLRTAEAVHAKPTRRPRTCNQSGYRTRRFVTAVIAAACVLALASGVAFAISQQLDNATAKNSFALDAGTDDFGYGGFTKVWRSDPEIDPNNADNAPDSGQRYLSVAHLFDLSCTGTNVASLTYTVEGDRVLFYTNARMPEVSYQEGDDPYTEDRTTSFTVNYDEQKAPQRTADTPSDVLANAAAETKRDKGVYASMKRAFSPYVENHSHAVLYGIIGFVAAALILIVGFWPTVLLAVFAAIGVVIGKYRDGDRKTRQQMKQVLERFN